MKLNYLPLVFLAALNITFAINSPNVNGMNEDRYALEQIDNIKGDSWSAEAYIEKKDPSADEIIDYSTLPKGKQ